APSVTPLTLSYFPSTSLPFLYLHLSTPATFTLSLHDALPISLPEAKLGIFPFQVMASLLRHLPESKVLKLCIDSSAFTFQKAKKWGQVDAVCNDENILSYRNQIL